MAAVSVVVPLRGESNERAERHLEPDETDAKLI